MRRTLLAAMAGVALTAVELGAQTIEAGDLVLDLTGRVQVQLNTTSVDAEELGIPVGPAETAFETRRIRFGTDIAYGDWLTGTVEADFSGEGARLTDAYVNVPLLDGLELRAGQFKKPFGRIELTSSTQIPMIERSVRIRGLEPLVEATGSVIGEEQWLLDEAMHAGRQIGAMVHGEVGAFGYGAGVFNGEGANTGDVRSSKAWAARLTYGLTDALSVGGGVSAQPTGSFGADADEEHAVAYELDAQYGGFREPGLWLLAELMAGENPLLGDAESLAEMAGAQAVAAWFAPRQGQRVEGLEPVLRLSWGDPDREVDDDSGWTVTPGFNLYFTGRNRFMINGEAYFPSQEGLEAEYALVTQLQIYF